MLARRGRGGGHSAKKGAFWWGFVEQRQLSNRAQFDHSLVGGANVVSGAVKCRQPAHLP